MSSTSWYTDECRLAFVRGEASLDGKPFSAGFLYARAEFAIVPRMDLSKLIDPVKFCKMLWPRVTLYRQQEDLMYSVRDHDETFCVAGNMLGKDFTAGIILLWFFLTRTPCRIVTTSADFPQLRSVLWGEMRRFIASSKFPLDSERGGPLVVNDMHIRKIVRGEMCGISYIIGRVSDKAEGMLGHHATPDSADMSTGLADEDHSLIGYEDDGVPRTLMVGDEASAVSDEAYKAGKTWMKRGLFIGNAWECQNFFRRACDAGDRWSEDGRRCYQKIIRIRAQDSPNVRFAEAEISAGKKPSGRILVPGVISYAEYRKRRETFDEVNQCITLDAQFWEGAEVLLFPPKWLNRAEELAALYVRRRVVRKAKAIGVDPAEGGDKTCMCAVDEYGVIELVSKKTPDTDDIIGDVIAFGKKHGVDPENWIFDRGGGGKQHADRLRKKGYNVRIIGFGEKPTVEPRRGMTPIEERKRLLEERYSYKNRRSEMYWTLSELLNPANGQEFCIPAEYHELRRQISKIPRTYDEEGIAYVLPKRKKSPNSKELSLIDIIGHSPDEADSCVLAVYGMTHPKKRIRAGVAA